VKRRLALVAVLAALSAPASAGALRAVVLPQAEVPAARLAVLPPSTALAPLAPLAPQVPVIALPSLSATYQHAPGHADNLSAAARPGDFGYATEISKPGPAGATALSRLQFSALHGAAAIAPGVSAGAAKSLASKSFDGARTGSGDEDAAAPAPPADGGSSAEEGAPRLPSYLDTPDPENAAWVASVVAEASRSKTGRAVLARLERLALERGRPVMVLVAPIGNSGEYAFDHEIVTMDSGHKSHPAVDAAPVFIHELAHVLQLAQGLPVDAFEMELEAYIYQFRVSDELGFKPKRGTFHWSAYRRFKNDLDRFMAWLLKEYDGNLAITGKGSLSDYEAQLEQRHFEATGKLERLEKRAAAKRRVIERMAATGQPAQLIEQYRLDELAPLEEKLRVQKRELGWMERDLLLLRTPESRERYRRYAERVVRKARAYHARLGVDG
jgi:hypothetical protein